MSLTVRDANASDLDAVHAIYAHHVRHGFGTFDETPPPLDRYESTWRDVVDAGLAWLVATDQDQVLGFAYASPFRPRTGYRYTVEDTVYVRADRCGRGIGRALLKQLIVRCEAAGARQIVAVIGDSQNAGSIALHAKAGFVNAGTMKSAGFKLGRWVDVVLMQRAVNGGDVTPPPVRGAWR